MRKKMQLVEQDKTLLSRRDSNTNILFTWECAPDKPIRAWVPGEDESVDFEVKPMIETHFKSLVDDPTIDPQEYLVAGWASAVGAFNGYVDHFLEHYNKLED